MDIHIAHANAAAEAVNAVFGDDISSGPRIPAGFDTLTRIIDEWPAHPDDVVNISLELPMDFDISKPMAINDRKGVVIRGHLVNIICGGQRVGLALRVDDPSIGSIETWIAAHRAWRRKLMQAH